MKDADIHLTCRQCGKEFVFTSAEQEFYELKGFTQPNRCKECRSARQGQPQTTVCSRCGATIGKEASVYCNACLENIYREFEQVAKKRQKTTSELHTKLLAIESQRAELEEFLRKKELTIEELERSIKDLNKDLEKANQFHSATGWLKPSLNDIESRLEALEKAQNKINERMLQMVQKMHEMYDGTNLLEVVKRTFRQYTKEGA